MLARDLTVDTDIRGTRGIEYIYIVRSTEAPETTPASTTAPATPPADMLAPKPAAAAPSLAPGDVTATPATSATVEGAPATATSGTETESTLCHHRWQAADGAGPPPPEAADD